IDLIACFNYGGRQEILDSVNRFISENPDKPLDEDSLRGYMYVPDIPDPDLIVRTSGEFRLSNFWLWQCSYSELYFTDVLWPDFDSQMLDTAIESFKMRDRRYGGLR
ncbi:MAG: isoprenyl transferase, partial [Synergistales bacterium]|nr:isoprenyl transferase [Synergistales bacterium]